MYRQYFPPRPDWENIIASQGLVYDLDNPDDPTEEHYWNESYAYVFTREEVDAIASQAENLYGMCIEAADRVLRRQLGDPEIPEKALDLARRSYANGDVDVYSRFDVVFDPETLTIKLLEYNSDTPTSIVETAVCQDAWAAYHDGVEAIGSLGSSLVGRWAEIKSETRARRLHIAHVSEELDPQREDMANCFVMAHCARVAGWEVKVLPIEEVIFNEELKRWEDAEGEQITDLFKIYPWEDMVTDSESGYDELLFEHYDSVRWYNPAWKLGSSTKLLLPALWKAFNSHPNLLPAYVGFPGQLTNWVRKPYFGREGEGITVHAPDYSIEEAVPSEFFGPDSPYIYQEYCPLLNFEGDDHEVNLPILGVWMVGSRFAGLAVRESSSVITDADSCRFTPAVMESTPSVPVEKKKSRWSL